MSPTFYHILHVISLLVLSAWIFMGFANPDPNRRKQTLIITGIAGLLVFISGFGLYPKLGYALGSVWIIVKIACWAGLMAIAGMGFRRPGSVRVLTAVALALLSTSVFMVYLKPGTKAREAAAPATPEVPAVLQK